MGNALAKEYNVKDQCASGGPSFLWKVYPATKKNTGEVGGARAVVRGGGGRRSSLLTMRILFRR